MPGKIDVGKVGDEVECRRPGLGIDRAVDQGCIDHNHISVSQTAIFDRTLGHRFGMKIYHHIDRWRVSSSQYSYYITYDSSALDLLSSSTHQEGDRLA